MSASPAAEAAARAHTAAVRDLDDRKAALSLPVVRPESVAATVAGELRTLLRPLEEAAAWDEHEAATLERAAATLERAAGEWVRGGPTVADHYRVRAATLWGRAQPRRTAAASVLREIEEIEGTT